MSIQNEHGDEIVELPGMWSMIAKLALAGFIPLTLAALSFQTWVAITIFSHDTRISVLEYSSHQNNGRGNQTTSVNVGQTPTEDEAAKFRDYYTTEEVAAKLGKSARTVTSLCDSGAIPAVKEGREWHIPKDFELCGDQRLLAADSGN